MGKQVLDVHSTAAAPLAALASDWNCIAAELPHFTPQMFNVADLVYKTEHELVNRLNAIMKPAGLSEVYHISEAIHHATSKFISIAERDAVESVLSSFFTQIAGDHALECQQQSPICIGWMKQRTPVAHPTACPSQITKTQWLRQLYHSIQHGAEYKAVREAAMAICACLAGMWNILL